MTGSLSNLVINISDGIHKIKCKFRHDDKKCEICGIACKVCDCFFEYKNFKDGLIEYKCLCCMFMLRFLNIYNLSSNDNNEFILLLQKVVYPYEYMDDCEKLVKLTAT